MVSAVMAQIFCKQGCFGMIYTVQHMFNMDGAQK